MITSSPYHGLPSACIHVGGGAPPQDHLRARPVAGANSGCDREDNPREPLEWFPRRVGPTQLESLLGLLSDGVRPDADAIARGSHGEARRAEAHSDLGDQSGGGGGAMAYLLSRPYAASSGLGWNSAAQVSAESARRRCMTATRTASCLLFAVVLNNLLLRYLGS